MPSRWSVLLGLLGLTVLMGLLPPPGLVLRSVLPADPDTFLDLERRLMTAIQTGDRDTLESLVAQDFAIIGPDIERARLGAGGYLKAALTGDAVETFHIDALSSVSEGPGQVTVRMDVEWTSDAPEPHTRRVQITDTWQARAGTWELLRRHTRPADESSVADR